MPRGGSKKGEHRGGRVKGKPNKATIEKALLAEREVQQALAAGEKLGKEYLSGYARQFDEIAQIYKPTYGTKMVRGKLTVVVLSGDEKKFDHWSARAVDASAKLSPYQSPTFRAITIAPPPPENTGQETLFEVHIFSHDGKMIERDGKLIEHQPVDK